VKADVADRSSLGIHRLGSAMIDIRPEIEDFDDDIGR